MEKQTDSSVITAEKSVILLFSMRERIANILSVALMQCNFRILQAATSYLAMIKANQFLPDLVIIDITPNNTNDVLLVNRLQKSLRTKNIPILVVIPKAIRHFLDEASKQAAQEREGSSIDTVSMLEYPFNFADLLKEVKAILARVTQVSVSLSKKDMDAHHCSSMPAYRSKPSLKPSKTSFTVNGPSPLRSSKPSTSSAPRQAAVVNWQNALKPTRQPRPR